MTFFFLTNACYDIVDNNLREAVNGKMLAVRCKSIISILEDIKLMMMTRFHENRDAMDKWNGNLGPRIRKKLHKNKVDGWNCNVAWNTGICIRLNITMIAI